MMSRFAVALEFPDFRTMWLANMAAQAAAWALIVSRGWLVFDMTGSSMSVGIVTFAVMAPMLFMPPIAGVLADRMDRRALLGSTYAVNLFHNLALFLLAATGTIAEWHIIVLSVINGLARATQLSASQALAANLVPPERLLNALSLNASTQHASRLVGPALVAPLLGYFGAAPAFLLCTALYGIGWFQISRISVESRGGLRRGESFFRSFTDGLRYAWTQPLISMVLVMVFFHCGLTMAFESLLPNFTAQSLHEQTVVGEIVGGHEHMGEGGGFNTRASGFATLMVGVGLGSLVGSLLIGGVTSGLLRGRLYLALGMLSGLAQVALSLSTNMVAAWLAAVVIGGSQAAFMTTGQALMQSLAANEYRGRMASLNTLAFGGIMAVMNLFNGFVGTYYGSAPILFVNGILFTTVMVVSIAFATPRRVYVQGMPVRLAT